MSAEPGRTIKPDEFQVAGKTYSLGEKIAAGGMGVIYELDGSGGKLIAKSFDAAKVTRPVSQDYMSQLLGFDVNGSSLAEETGKLEDPDAGLSQIRDRIDAAVQQYPDLAFTPEVQTLREGLEMALIEATDTDFTPFYEEAKQVSQGIYHPRRRVLVPEKLKADKEKRAAMVRYGESTPTNAGSRVDLPYYQRPYPEDSGSGHINFAAGNKYALVDVIFKVESGKVRPYVLLERTGKGANMVDLNKTHSQERHNLSGAEKEKTYREQAVAKLEMLYPVAFKLDDLNYRHHRVHCDVKPGNITVDETGKIAKLVDMGGLTALHEESSVYTPFYAAVEQFEGNPVTTSTDQAALAITLVESLFGSEVLNRTRARTDYEIERIARDEPLLTNDAATVIAGKLGLDPARDRILLAAMVSFLETAVHKDPAQRLPDSMTLVGLMTELMKNLPEEQESDERREKRILIVELMELATYSEWGKASRTTTTTLQRLNKFPAYAMELKNVLGFNFVKNRNEAIQRIIEKLQKRNDGEVRAVQSQNPPDNRNQFRRRV